MVDEIDAGYVLNYCAKYLSRAPIALDDRAEAGASIAEAWRFPIVGPLRGAHPKPADDDSNLVTFVYKAAPGDRRPVAVLGTFATLHEPIPLSRIAFQGEDTGYRALSVVLPKSRLYRYKFQVDGQFIVDPVNPQRVRLGNGKVWSRFFTDGYLQPIVLEPWEVRLLYRLIEQILPFRSGEAENFLKRYYFDLNREQRRADLPKAFRLDESVGEVNAIDKFLAREEGHRLVDYRICLAHIDRVLRSLDPFHDPNDMDATEYGRLYDAMAASGSADENPIPGWDYAAYGSPAYFLYLLRRHAVTAAFCHPRYAGNVGGAGWAFLSERFRDGQGRTLFDWRPALEPPLGTSASYR